jgi:hypothetical protein
VLLLDHLAAHRLAHEEGALEIDRHREVEIGFSVILGGIFGTQAGVVHQDVDPAEAIDCSLYRAFDLIELGHVHLKLEHLAAHALDLARQLLPGLYVAQTQDDVGACVGERLGNAMAQAARSASDERHLSAQVEARKLAHPRLS